MAAGQAGGNYQQSNSAIGDEAMARPQKEGLDYFPLDVNADQDDKLLVPIARFGMQGYGIIIKLMSEIYKSGYYYHWGKKEGYVFANRVNVDINSINEVVEECIEYEFFNKEIFDKYQVLTSRGFQKRYVEAAKRRKEIVLINEYVLADLREISERLKISIFTVDANGNRVNEYIYDNKSPVTLAVSTQSKVKESKVNKSKELKELKELHESQFNSFWTLYPSKKGKTKALAKWLIFAPKLDFEKVMSGTQAYIEYCKAMDRTHQDGSTFVNNQSWNDEWIITTKPIKPQNFNNNRKGTSGKEVLPIYQNNETSIPISDEKRRKMYLMAKYMDEKEPLTSEELEFADLTPREMDKNAEYDTASSR